MTPWQIECFVWPYFPAGENQKFVGDCHQVFDIDAEDFDDAVKQGRNILTGIKTNPKVWQAGIRRVQEVDP